MSKRLMAGTLALVLAVSMAGAGAAKDRAAPRTSAAVSAGGSDYYTNVNGHRVHRPVQANRPPAGWTARCGDGSYSFSENHRGTCSHHSGVSQWR